MSSHSNPSRSSKSTSTSSKSKAYSRSSKSSSASFTPVMQDRQARNKDPYSSTDDSSESAWDDGNKRFDSYGNDTYENIKKRQEAAVILDNPELLMMHSAARCDSIPSTRHYFTTMLCGYHHNSDTYGSPLTAHEKEKNKLKPYKNAQQKKKIAGGSMKG